MEDSFVPPVSTCRNCENTIPESAVFCPVCGQKRTTGLVKVRELVKDFLDAAFNLDARFFRTIPLLFIPARLTRHFFEGKQWSFYKPLRLFFMTMVVFLGIFGFKFLNKIQDQLLIQTSYQAYLLSLNLSGEIDKTVAALGLDTVAVNDRTVIDTFIVDLKRQIASNVSRADIALFDSTLSVSMSELHELTADSILNKHNVKGLLKRQMVRQMIKVQKSPVRMFNFGVGNITWMIILLMPAVAMFMKLFYLRQKKYYVEHLVFLYHYHSFVFVLLSIFALFHGLLPKVMGMAILPGIILFLYLALKSYYQQGVFKTVAKLILLLIAYTVTLLIYILATTALSLLFFQ